MQCHYSVQQQLNTTSIIKVVVFCKAIINLSSDVHEIVFTPPVYWPLCIYIRHFLSTEWKSLKVYIIHLNFGLLLSHHHATATQYLSWHFYKPKQLHTLTSRRSCLVKAQATLFLGQLDNLQCDKSPACENSRGKFKFKLKLYLSLYVLTKC